MDFDQPPPFTEEPDRERPRFEQGNGPRCTVCFQPALPGYTTCGKSTCQEISTLRQRARNSRGKQAKKIYGEIAIIEKDNL